MSVVKKKVRSSKKLVSNVRVAKLFVTATFNNLILTVADEHGNALYWCSSGAVGAKGAKKSTSYMAEVVANKVLDKLKLYGITTLSIILKGPGATRDAVVRAIANYRSSDAAGIIVTGIADVTPAPHNGCRSRKRRKV